ncbi:RING-H2 finger protein ATL39 [Elaeis guineensis]|uniref:RING-H2 finger protein ATL39 n=1 Tax=Elaeis guineensis var. tenera TaxID=51953 RepID=A0A6I9RZE2_ELAGV|nr:RING-H2 finger protein ATL39 [Elaeis guineensis]
MGGFSMKLVTTVIGFGLSLTFVVFICVRLICSRIRSANSQAAALDVQLHSDFDPPEHSISGLEPAVVAAIPTMKYNRETFHSREDAQCTICLGEYQDREILRIMPACGHNFHRSCIDIWLQKQSTCPICRLSLNDLIEAKDVAFQAVNRLQVSNDHTNQWVLPSFQLLGGSRNNQGSQESVSVVVGFAYGEEP